MKQKLVVFDFDYTLYNAELWKDYAYHALAKLFGQEFSQFLPIAQAVYKKTRTIGYFDPEIFATQLLTATQSDLTRDQVLAVISDQALFQKAYYPETFTVLQSLQSIATFAMFSTNDNTFQAMKSQAVSSYFHQELLFIAKDKKLISHNIAALTQQYQVYLVDDLLEILEHTKKEAAEIFTIWIKRGPYATTTTNLPGFNPDKIIYNLSLLPDIIRDN